MKKNSYVKPAVHCKVIERERTSWLRPIQALTLAVT